MKKIIEDQIDRTKQKSPLNMSSSKVAKREKASLPSRTPREEKQKKYENLRRMPFSLNEEMNPMASPVNNLFSDEEEIVDSQSLEIELRQVNDEMLNYNDDSHLYQSFDIFDNEHLSPNLNHRKNESQIHNKNNKMIDSMNLYLNLGNGPLDNKWVSLNLPLENPCSWGQPSTTRPNSIPKATLRGITGRPPPKLVT